MKHNSLVGCLVLLLSTSCALNPMASRKPTRNALGSPSPAPTLTRDPPAAFQTETAAPGSSPTLASTPSPTVSSTPLASPTSIAAPVPEGLRVAYILQDTLYLWSPGMTRLLLAQPHIHSPLLSADRQWILIRQRASNEPPLYHQEEVWAVKSDGSERRRLLGPENLAALTETSPPLRLDEITWVPDRNELIFSTKQPIEGPPSEWPSYDLYLLNLAGQITVLAGAGQGGWDYVPAPKGRYVAVVTNTRLGLIDLESGEQSTLLVFEPIGTGTDIPYIPRLIWEQSGRFLMTSIPPQKLFAPDYNGEPEQIWKLSVDGTSELIYQRRVFQPVTMSLAPNLRNLLFLAEGCGDGQGMLHVLHLATGEEQPRYCVWNLPMWAADGEHYIFWQDGLWQLGSIFEVDVKTLEFVNLPTSSPVITGQLLRWINETHFLLVMQAGDSCTLNIATIEGVVTQIVSSQSNSCPDADFSMPQG